MIFKILSNLNHNGTLYKAGQFIDAELEEFNDFVKDKVLKIVDGASSVDEAQKIDDENNLSGGDNAPVETAPIESQDTWAATKETPADGTVDDKHEISQEDLDNNPDLVKADVKVGEQVELGPKVVDNTTDKKEPGEVESGEQNKPVEENKNTGDNL